jgi:MSHA biogenesis protein MshI
VVVGRVLARLKLPSLKRTLPGWLAVQEREGVVRFCAIRRGAGGPAVTLFHEAPPGDLASLRRSLNITAYRALTVMNPGSYSLIQTEAPSVPRPEWRDAVRWRLKDLLDFPAETAIFDVADVPTEAFAPGRQQQCYVVAAPREQVSKCVAALEDARFDLQAVDIPEMAQRNLAALFEEENRAVAFLAFDDVGALLTVTFHGELYGSRRIDVAASQVLAADEFRRQQLLERVALETQRTLDAFDRQFSFMTVTRLILAAPPELEGVKEALANNLYIPVVPMDLASVLDLSAVPALQASAAQMRALPLIGAALREDVA